MRTIPLMILLVMNAVATGQSIVLPQLPPVPTDKVAAVVAKALTPDVIYDIRAKTDCVIRAYPKDLVTITKDVVPAGQTLRDKGNFYDGAKTHIYVGPITIYQVKAVGKGKVDLVVIPVGFKTESDIVTVSLAVDGDAEPKPDDPKPPDPIVELPPIPGPGLKVLLTYESGVLMPGAQIAILNGKTVRDYLEAKSPVGPDGKTKEYRIYDKDTDTSGESKLWQDAMKRPRTQVLWCIISDGKSKANSYEGPLPASVDEFMKLLRKAGE